MKIGAPKEIFDGENRVAMTPESAIQLIKLGHTCVIESGAGAKAGFSDAAYAAAGVTVLPDAKAVFDAADVVVKVRGPEPSEAALLKRGHYGIYHYMSAKHLHRYVNEFSFRHNTAQAGTMPFIDMTLSRAVGKRLTYKGLINA